MPPTVHLVRHAQGLHNLSIENEELPDPDLTPLGIQQCSTLKLSFPHHDRITRLYASPLRRTISTCHLAFGAAPTEPRNEAARPGERVITLIPELREAAQNPCDLGSEPHALEQEFGALVDGSRLFEGWNAALPWTTWAARVDATQLRAAKARRLLKELIGDLHDEEHVVVVTHGAFLHFLTEDYHGVAEGKATGWRNAELRSYHFLDSDALGTEARLVETQDSWSRRYEDKPRPTAKDQAVLRELYYQYLEPYVLLRK